MGLAQAISKLTTPNVLGIVYYAVITPMGVARRFLSGSPVRRTGDAPSWWVSRRESPKGDLERQF